MATKGLRRVSYFPPQQIFLFKMQYLECDSEDDVLQWGVMNVAVGSGTNVAILQYVVAMGNGINGTVRYEVY